MAVLAQLPTSARARVLAVVLLLVLIILAALLAVTAARWLRRRAHALADRSGREREAGAATSAWEEAGKRAVADAEPEETRDG